jgi:hypothetical protein
MGIDTNLSIMVHEFLLSSALRAMRRRLSLVIYT